MPQSVDDPKALILEAVLASLKGTPLIRASQHSATVDLSFKHSEFYKFEFRRS
jgi:hypothetical protein